MRRDFVFEKKKGKRQLVAGGWRLVGNAKGVAVEVVVVKAEVAGVYLDEGLAAIGGRQRGGGGGGDAMAAGATRPPAAASF